MYANVATITEEGDCTLRIECLTESVNKFWITVSQNGTTIVTRRMINCNTSATMMVDGLSMLPGEFDYEIEVVIGEDINVILLGGFAGSK